MRSSKSTPDYFEAMSQALDLAKTAHHEVPVAALLYSRDGEILTSAVNNRNGTYDPTGHAEIIALRKGAVVLEDWRLEGCTLVVTLEPCIMCAGAIMASRIKTLVYGAFDPKEGAAGSLYDILRDVRLGHSVEVVPGVLNQECSLLLTDFFGTKRG